MVLSNLTTTPEGRSNMATCIGWSSERVRLIEHITRFSRYDRGQGARQITSHENEAGAVACEEREL